MSGCLLTVYRNHIFQFGKISALESSLASGNAFKILISGFIYSSVCFPSCNVKRDIFRRYMILMATYDKNKKFGINETSNAVCSH